MLTRHISLEDEQTILLMVELHPHNIQVGFMKAAKILDTSKTQIQGLYYRKLKYKVNLSINGYKKNIPYTKYNLSAEQEHLRKKYQS